MPTSNREVADLKKQVRELQARLTEIGEDEVDDLTDRAADYFSHGKEKATDWIEALRDQGFEVGKRAKKMAKGTDEFMHENPWRVAAGALALGVIAGFFLSRHD